jgi:carbon storage regulator
MLVLSRKEKEAIRIGDDIEVIVSEIQGGRVRLAISAPSDVPINRREVAERMQHSGPAVAPPPDSKRRPS